MEEKNIYQLAEKSRIYVKKKFNLINVCLSLKNWAVKNLSKNCMLQTDKVPLRSEFNVSHSSGSATLTPNQKWTKIHISHTNFQMCWKNLGIFLIKKINEVLQSEQQNSKVVYKPKTFLEKIIFEQIQIIWNWPRKKNFLEYLFQNLWKRSIGRKVIKVR